MLQRKIIVVVFLLFTTLCITAIGMTSEKKAGHRTQGDQVTVLTPGTTARLCPHPACGPDEHILRIPQGTTLKVEGIEKIKIGSITVVWYEVVYQEDRGWISIFDTNAAQ
jgi:hypothetical protein